MAAQQSTRLRARSAIRWAAVLPLLLAAQLFATPHAATPELSDKGAALLKALANPKTYDLDPAQWFDGIWADPVTKDELAREYFVSRRQRRDGTTVFVWVYMERLFNAAPAILERQRWRISCTEETAGVDTLVDPDGTTHAVKVPHMVPVPPDSASNLVMVKVCAKQ